MCTRPTITTSTRDGVSFVQLDGELDLACAEELRQLAENAITDDTRTLRIDMSAVSFADSTMLHALITMANKARDRGCKLILENPCPPFNHVLDVSGLASSLTVEAS